MLRSLSIRDFVIVDRLELEFSSGFGALTGETGAGKSILIDALALALGERADAGVVRAGRERAEVGAVFDISAQPEVAEWLAAHDFSHDDELLLRRVIDAGGRSRAYINGSSATAQQLREVGDWLVDIHGQHAHQSLLRPDAQRQLFDQHAGLSGLVMQLGETWRAWRAARQTLEQATHDAESLQREREQLEWQVAELERLAFTVDEWNQLEIEQRRLGHAAGLMAGAQFALEVLAGEEVACEKQVDSAVARLQGVAEFDPALAEVAALLESVQAELGEAVSQLQRYLDRVDLDPERLSEVEQRIDAILAQARRQRVTPAELPALLIGWQRRLGELQAAADLELLQSRVVATEAAYRALAGQLSEARRAAAVEVGRAVSATMQQLALASGRFEVALLEVERPAPFGLEQVEFRIGGLAGNEARPLAKVASGGELSRISLAIQVLTSRSAKVPTLIFDEVDVGIGGGVAEIVGRLLRQLGAERQVLCVTHLPQVAARANWQWQVAKSRQGEEVVSSIYPLGEQERIGEIARMLGGVELTEITLAHARELLALETI
ncbi:DNA repair protein RecN [Dechloromonas sp. ZY10]|uniref:DNA repair protein RecN n=1 Tax=Dechloromonas aquae TaxID=2664436 RepID=UPI0035271CBA